MNRQLASGLFFMVGGLLVGYVLATAWVDYKLPGEIGFGYLIANIWSMKTLYPDLFNQVWIIELVNGIAGFAFGLHFASEKLTDQGTSEWQSARDMRRNDLLGKPGAGFVLAKTTSPLKNGTFITSDTFPNCLIIAPTGAGKGVGFVYPNLLTFEGSTVTLDLAGENYDTTARWRAKMGDKVYKFAPSQFGEQSYRYNPLERIGKLESYSQISFELRKIATLFLQADGAGEWLNGAIQLFTVAGAVAHERGQFTLGGIHRVLAQGDGDMRQHIGNLAKAAIEPALKLELTGLYKLESRTLASYMSVMNNAGFDLWSNPHIDEMTSTSDFTFSDLRRERTSIFFKVVDGDLKPMAGLVRLFFNELVTTIQATKPGPDEPYPVMLILDEFHRLGKMSVIADAMTTIRKFNGRIAIITQTIPKLDVIYSYEERLSIQGGAGLKLYMTPSEEMTIEDLSKACGMTTKRNLTKSRRSGLNEKTTFTERTDEKPLLTEDEARRLPKDTSIIIVNGKQPVKVKPIIHYQDPVFASILKEQEKLSWDIAPKVTLEDRVQRLEDAEKVGAVKSPAAGANVQEDAQEEESRPNAVASEPEEPTTESLARINTVIDGSFELFEKVDALPDKKTVTTKANAAAIPAMLVNRKTTPGKMKLMSLSTEVATNLGSDS